MKTKRILQMLLVCLMIPVSLMLTGCGKNIGKVEGKTLSLDKIDVIWDKTATTADKNEVYEELEVTSDKEIKEKQKEVYWGSSVFDFQEDGILKLRFREEPNGDLKENQLYYAQSEDGKKVNLFQDEDKTLPATDGFDEFDISGKYMIKTFVQGLITIKFYYKVV